MSEKRLSAAQQAGLFAARKRNRLMTTVGNSVVAPAWGTISFASNPTNGQTVTINGTVVTFVTGAPIGAQVKIGLTLADTLVAVQAFFAANPVSGVGSVAASDSSLTVLSAGPADTTITLAASAATVSHATLQAQTVRARQPLNSVTVLP